MKKRYHVLYSHGDEWHLYNNRSGPMTAERKNKVVKELKAKGTAVKVLSESMLAIFKGFRSLKK